jgi:hypothetical protein
MIQELPMMRSYQYHGFTIEVAVQSGFSWPKNGTKDAAEGYAAIVSIIQAGAPVAMFSPLRFVDSARQPFSTQGEALMGGYGAGRRIVDDLFSPDPS